MKHKAVLPATILFFSLCNPLAAVTVPEVTLAYGKLNVSLQAYILSAKAATESQKLVNKGLEKQLTYTKTLNEASTYSIQQLKTLNSTVSPYADLVVSSNKMENIQNEVDLFYSKVLEKRAVADDLKYVK